MITIASVKQKSLIILTTSRKSTSQPCLTDGKGGAQILETPCCGHAGHLRLIGQHGAGGVELEVGIFKDQRSMIFTCSSQHSHGQSLLLFVSSLVPWQSTHIRRGHQVHVSNLLLKVHMVQDYSTVAIKSGVRIDGQEINFRTHSGSALKH